MDAPTITSPAGSVTVPVIVAFTPWPNAIGTTTARPTISFTDEVTRIYQPLAEAVLSTPRFLSEYIGIALKGQEEFENSKKNSRRNSRPKLISGGDFLLVDRCSKRTLKEQ